MKRWIAFFVAIGLIVAVCQCGFLKSDEQKIEDRMNTFLKAYNAGDFNSALDSMDAKTRNTYKAYMNVGNALIGLSGFGVEISDLFALGVSLSDGQTLEFKNMEIKILSETKATVSVTMYYRDYQSTYSENTKFTLVKEDNDWYICG